MILYCPNCQACVDKVNELYEDGKTITRQCKKCGSWLSYYIKYKAYSEYLDKKSKRHYSLSNK